MKKLLITIVSLVLLVLQINAQQKVVHGTVYAFKNLPLNNIEITAAKAKTTAQTDSLGMFKIICTPEDKLSFSGDGFKKLTRKLEREERTIKVKMIFKGGNKNIAAAVENNIVSKEHLENSIELHPDQNYEYYNYTDIFSAIDRIYISNQNITVRDNKVYVRKDQNSASGYPAIYIVNGKLALEIENIQPRDIESIEIIPDGSAEYGPGAANGVVIITTNEQ